MIAVWDRAGDELRESVAYMVAAAPKRPGLRPVVGPPGSEPTENQVETGLIDSDLAGLVERIAARVRWRQGLQG